MGGQTLLFSLHPDPLRYKDAIHIPLIETVALPRENNAVAPFYDDIDEYTHLIVMSKTAVSILTEIVPKKSLQQKQIFSVGKGTTNALAQQGIRAAVTASIETQEGLIAALKKEDLSSAYVGVPCSSLSRSALIGYLSRSGVRFQTAPIYTTVRIGAELPPLTRETTLVFTSPSSVEAFIACVDACTFDMPVIVQGPITFELASKYFKNIQTKNLINALDF